MNKVLVTGTAGFVGFHLVNKLASLGYIVTGIDNINDYYDVSLKTDRLKQAGIGESLHYNRPVQSSKYSNYTFIKLDIKDKPAIFKLFEVNSFDFVINLAAQAGVRYSLINPDSYVESNIVGFTNILEACRHYPVQHLIFASSSSIYGENKKIPFEETDVTDKPVSLYAATKKANELFAHTYAHLYKIPCSGLRFFTVYGPWGRPDMAYFSFTKAILEGKPIKVFNNGNMLRDFTYIDDIVDAISLLITKKPATSYLQDNDAPYTIYNIGANSPVKLMDFIKVLENEIGKKATLDFLPMQPGDVPATYADTSKLNSTIDSFNKISIEEGIPSFVQWFFRYYKIANPVH